MRFGLQLGYWGARPPANVPELVAAAEEIGFDGVFTAESWGSDAFTPLAWWGSATRRVRLGTSVVQLSARTPTATAMAALTLDHLSAGRAVLGLGVSGPQVVEGWYGQPFAKPLQRTREYVDIVRQVLAREGKVTSAGPHYPLPYNGPGSTGLGKPLKPITHPRRADIPIWLGAEGPKNVALTAEIADGWLAIYYTPRLAGMYDEWLDEGFARPGARRSRADFEIAASCQVVITDDARGELDRMKPVMALYIGGMGAEELNFHAQVYRRMGYGEVVDEITRLFRTGRKDKAAAAVPDELILDTAIIGDRAQVRSQLRVWEKAGVTQLLVSAHSVEQLRQLAPLVQM
ncbi:LLM class F420-dependent oxidoreductase [Nocardia pseudobrasiliensis]|uniref:F420-dependent oxidoreductase-like protein n=1 Tax=Nocardia pseudobrasiliensis TaxID=45979 RepID=A0A370I7S4_9NOCA|nr:LLM class F420-dependent oxidoreductase [Nocardia pseudobrasiliensis]RDI66191.1 F420-dependent oxidoreductase-like protein [Nocardia pseudobrasiliensis]